MPYADPIFAVKKTAIGNMLTPEQMAALLELAEPSGQSVDMHLRAAVDAYLQTPAIAARLA